MPTVLFAGALPILVTIAIVLLLLVHHRVPQDWGILTLTDKSLYYKGWSGIGTVL